MKNLTLLTSTALVLSVACDANPNAPLDVTDIPLTATVGAGVQGKIAYTSDADGDFDIYVKNADGSTRVATNLTDYSAADETDAVFSPDGEFIVFVSTRHSNADLYRLHLKTGVEDRLTTNGAEDYAPTFAPDGDEIAFATMRNGDPDIYILDLITMTDRPLVSSSGVVEVNPAWSPTGQTIAYQSDGDIYMIPANGAGPAEQLTRDAALDDLPAWAPDGSEVSFVTLRNGNQDIYAVGLDRLRTVRAVAAGPHAETSHTWSTEGLAYASGWPTAPSDHIYVVTSAAAYNLTTVGGALDAMPDWWVAPPAP